MISFAGIDNASASSFSVNTGGIFTGAFGSTSGFFTGSGLMFFSFSYAPDSGSGFYC